MAAWGKYGVTKVSYGCMAKSSLLVSKVTRQVCVPPPPRTLVLTAYCYCVPSSHRWPQDVAADWNDLSQHLTETYEKKLAEQRCTVSGASGMSGQPMSGAGSHTVAAVVGPQNTLAVKKHLLFLPRLKKWPSGIGFGFLQG